MPATRVIPAKTNAPRLQPDGIPERVGDYPFHQAGAHRVADQVSRHRAQVFLVAQGMVVVRRCPQRAVPAEHAIGRARTGRFEAADHLRQRIAGAQFDQPVRVVRHQHPGQRRGIAPHLPATQATANRAGSHKVGKERRPVVGGTRHVVNVTRCAVASATQCRMTRPAKGVHAPIVGAGHGRDRNAACRRGAVE